MFLYLCVLAAIAGLILIVFGIILIRSNHIHDLIVYPWLLGFTSQKLGGKKKN
ncbi:MAG: hypothetical protein J5636_03490 [Clostridiales bacterium]|nr:hypothetical protein [Clostridiales bacterium]